MRTGLRSVIAVALLGLLVYAAWSQREWLLHGLSRLTVGQIALVIAVMLPLYPLSVLAWHQLLLGVGAKLTYREALAVWMLGNVARLLPGTVWQFVGRMYLARAHGVTTLQSSISIAYEIATLVVTSLLIGVVTLPLWPASLHLPGWLGLLAIVPLCFLWPRLLPWVVQLYGKVRKQEIADVPQLPWDRLLVAVAATAAQSFLSGLAIWLLVDAFSPVPTLSIVVFTGMEAFAWLLGYVTVLAPGGVGVADASLAALLASELTMAIGSVAALSFRVLLLVVESLVTLVAVGLNPHVLAEARKQRSPAS